MILIFYYPGGCRNMWNRWKKVFTKGGSHPGLKLSAVIWGSWATSEPILTLSLSQLQYSKPSLELYYLGQLPQQGQIMKRFREILKHSNNVKGLLWQSPCFRIYFIVCCIVCVDFLCLSLFILVSEYLCTKFVLEYLCFCENGALTSEFGGYWPLMVGWWLLHTNSENFQQTVSRLLPNLLVILNNLCLQSHISRCAIHIFLDKDKSGRRPILDA